MKVKSLSVFFPAFNEEKNIANTVKKAFKVVSGFRFPWEIIIVDDGSTDETKKVSLQLAKSLKNVRLVSQKNGGYGSALRTGFKQSKYDWIVYTDSDGQFDFGQIDKFLKAAEGADAVWGYRQDRHDPWYRKIFALLWKIPTWALLGITLKDADCGFKLIRKQALEQIMPLQSDRGAMINVELAYKLQQKGFKIVECPVNHYPRLHGQPSGYALSVVINSYKDLLMMWLGSNLKKLGLLLTVLGVLAASSYLLPFTYWPEFLNWPYFMMSGWLPYKDIAIIHTPLLLWITQAAYTLLGANIVVLHGLGTLLLLLTSLLIFLIQQKDYRIGLLSSAVFGFLALAFQGNTVWFESALAPLLIVSFVLMVQAFDSLSMRRGFFLGVVWGLMLGTKQTSLYFAPVLIIYFVYLFIRKQKLITGYFLAFVLGVLTPVFLIVLKLIYLGVGDDFYYWAIRFVFFKTGSAGGEFAYTLLPTLPQGLVLVALLVVATIITKLTRSKKAFLAWGFFVCSLLLAYPRFGYFHLIPSVAFVALLLGQLSFKKKIDLLLLGVTITVGLFVFWRSSVFSQTFLTSKSWELASRLETTYAGSSIFIFNGPDEVYNLSQTLPAVKPWVPQLPWYYHYYGDSRFFNDFVKSSPQVVVMAPFLEQSIDGLGAYQTEPLTSYLRANYTPVEFVGDVIILKAN